MSGRVRGYGNGNSKCNANLGSGGGAKYWWEVKRNGCAQRQCTMVEHSRSACWNEQRRAKW